MQAVGLTIYPYRYGRAVKSIDEITAIVNATGPTTYWLEEYHPTFHTTKIRIQTAENKETGYELVCTSTIRLELPVDNGWVGTITIKQDTEHRVELTDRRNRVLVVAGSVSLHAVARRL